MRFRQEITVWDKAPTTPNHTYITEGSYLIGIVPEGTKESLHVFVTQKSNGQYPDANFVTSPLKKNVLLQEIYKCYVQRILNQKRLKS